MCKKHVPFCKVYETEGGDKTICFPTKMGDKGDSIERYTYNPREDADLDVLAKFFNDRAERWAKQLVFELEGMVEQICADLNGAHGEICKLQDIDPEKFDWPAWTPQANSIRAAEKVLGKRLAKTNNWTIFPDQDGERQD
jgi:hypothetical protein